MSNNFKKLRDAMSPEAREQARKLAETMAAEIPQSSGKADGLAIPSQPPLDDVNPDDPIQK